MKRAQRKLRQGARARSVKANEREDEQFLRRIAPGFSRWIERRLAEVRKQHPKTRKKLEKRLESTQSENIF
jgi:hypothetical protein